MTFSGLDGGEGKEGGMVLLEEVVEWTDGGRAARGRELIRAYWGRLSIVEKSEEERADGGNS